jgi:hypothetical protein
MQLHANNTVHTEWVPITDEIVDQLHDRYHSWIDNLTEIRTRLETLRDDSEAGWKPSADLTERLNDLNKRDEVYAAKYMDTARAFLDAAEAEVTATKPQREQHAEKLKAALKDLRRAWENGWEKSDVWTPEERGEFMWLAYCNPELTSLRRIAEHNTTYFCQKLVAFYKLKNEEILIRSLNQKPRIRLGLKLLGRGRK